MKKYYYIDIWDDFSIRNINEKEINNLKFICEYFPQLTELFWKQYVIKLKKPTLASKIDIIIFQYCKKNHIPFNFVAYQDETCESNEVIEELTNIKIKINNEDILNNNEVSIGGFYYFLRNVSDNQKQDIKSYFQMIYKNQQKMTLKREK